MASEPNVNVSDSVVMGSIINLKEIHNLIIKIDSSELGTHINNLLNHKKDNENNSDEVKYLEVNISPGTSAFIG